MKTKLILKNGYKFQGQILGETATELIILEIKLGKTKIDKASISVRSDGD